MIIKNTIRSQLLLRASKVNWSLLLFLVLVLNVKLLVKVIAILLFTVLNHRMLMPVIGKKKFIIFYGVMIGIALLNMVLSLSFFSLPYFLVVCTGVGFWLMSGLSAVLSTWFVRNTDLQKLQATLMLFFILNAIITFAMLLWIMYDSGSINPYTFQGFYQKYFISTGDRMTGISFDTSVTNALFNAFGVVYFLHHRKMFMVLLCMSVLILTSSNLTNILLIGVLLYQFIVQSDRDQKSIIVVCIMMLLVFLIKISPQDFNSVINVFRKMAGKKNADITAYSTPADILQKPDSLLNDEERKQKIAIVYLDSIAREQMEKRKEQPAISTSTVRDTAVTGHLLAKPFIPEPSIHSASYQINNNATDQQKKLLAFAMNNIARFDTTSAIRTRRIPGKIISMEQTIHFFKSNPWKLITGSGIGRFSSKLAFRATGLQMSGGYPQRFVFIDSNFKNNHLNLYITYFSKHKELHSLIHTPNSVYDQLIAEYGIAGLLAFIWLYIGFFIKKIRQLTYGVPLLIIVAGAFAVDYWFEQLSIIILFELMMLINIKERKEENG